MSSFITSFSSNLGGGLSNILTGLIAKKLLGTPEKGEDYYKKQQEADAKRQAKINNFVDKQNLAQTNLLNSINDSNDLLEHKYDESRQQKLDASNKHLATIRAYAGLHGTSQTNAIRNQLENETKKTDDTIKDLKYNTQHQLNTNIDKFNNFVAKQKLDYQGILL